MKIKKLKDSLLLSEIKKVCDSVENSSDFYVYSSGTTGKPKRIMIDLKTAFLKKRLVNPDECWLLTYSPQRWAGISVVLHVMKSGSTLCVPSSMATEDILEAAIFLSPDCVSFTPSMFRNLLRHDIEGILKKTSFKQVTFGGEAASQSVLDLAASCWPHSRITHVYASTEIGDICSVSDGLAGVPLNKFKAYEFTEEGELIVNGIWTGDIWTREGERYMFVGRRQEIINVGGNKVSPMSVEEAAIRVGADTARAFAVPSPLMGNLVGLEYVGGPVEIIMQEQLRTRLTKYACPASICQVQEIQLSVAGKTNRFL